jgi:HSP20 family protein
MTRINHTPSEITPFALFHRMWDDFAVPTQPQLLRPAIDVTESESAVRVTAELPGLAKEDVKITIEDGVLSISGEKKTESETKDHTFHRVERSFGAFQRSLSLPNGLDVDRADATFRDGVLTIELPKTEAMKPKTLKVK